MYLLLKKFRLLNGFVYVLFTNDIKLFCINIHYTPFRGPLTRHSRALLHVITWDVSLYDFLAI